MDAVAIGRVTAICTEAAARAGANTTDRATRLNEQECFELLDAIGLSHAPCLLLTAEAESGARAEWAAGAVRLADQANRLLLKVVGRELLHKTELGGVRILKLPAADAQQAILTAAEQLLVAVATSGGSAVEGVLAAGFVPHAANQPGQELLLSLRVDATFGPVVVVGIGGTLTEWYGRGTSGASRLIFPAARLEPAEVIAALAAHPLLSLVCRPSRLYGEPPLPATDVADAVVRMAELGLACGPQADTAWTLEELELNPTVVADGRLVALDGVGLISAVKWPQIKRPLAKIQPLLAPRSAVVMGVRAKAINPGRIILNNLQRSEGIKPGHLYVVHRSELRIDGVPCFQRVTELPEKCDLAVVAIPAEGALEAITDLVTNDATESIILIPGGFAEAGQHELAAAIERQLELGHAGPGGGPVMVGGNCLGIVSRDQYNTFFLPQYKLPFRPGRGGNLALVSQSGAYLVTFASNYDGIILPRASISFGNQMDLTAADFLDHFAGEEQVDVVAFYIEGFKPGDGARFLDAVRKARSSGQRVIVLKAGKTALGAEAAASHTASLAGDYDIARASLASAGVTVADTLDFFEDCIKTFTLLAGKRPVGRRIGIISNAGFECSIVMDELEGFELARFDAATEALLDEVLPSFAHRTNPVDCTPMTATEPFLRSTQAILDCSQVDLAIISSVPVTPALENLEPDRFGAHTENLYAPTSQPQRLGEILGSATKPAVVVVDSGRIYDPMALMIERAGVPVFRKIDRAARALAAFCELAP